MIGMAVVLKKDTAYRYGIKMYIVQARDVIDNYNVLLQISNPICFDAIPTF